MTVTAPPHQAVRSRGTTRISDRAVERIVARVLDEAGDSDAMTRTMLGVPLRGRRGSRTDVRVDAEIVTIRTAISVTYPRPVREVARRVRESVRGRVEELTGLSVRQVDIEVAELERPTGRALA
ncbi:Asp23/Gls24 family envelope stress response protein [Actinomadura litoris]|uniref:Asp23/Gls24 family envelope stress response protein n=1 Tax=Actinomadura litoris TaxID=2678616 RepID=A0A7K1KYA4_9ACTN|nr:Asp23/Gls24 family envelope stress response protein [Actinomadura litoris]MUN37043.1 Asp23/Gls24 family envelope stress response protein [Actinomadura litoris]